MDKSNFKERLREERKRLGFDQGEAASLCGVSRETWSRYELGKMMPGCDLLAAFAAAGADAQYILTGNRSRSPNEDKSPAKYAELTRKKLDKALDDLSPEQQAELTKQVDLMRRLNQCEVELEEFKKKAG